MAKELATHFHLGEIRFGAGTAWIRVHWDVHNVPSISFYGSKEPGQKILGKNVPAAVKALLAAGHENLVIEKALR